MASCIICSGTDATAVTMHYCASCDVTLCLECDAVVLFYVISALIISKVRHWPDTKF
jgi:hypothetical protein